MVLEHAAEVLGVFETESVGYLCYGIAGGEQIFCQLYDVLPYVVACRIAGGFFYRIAEIVGRHAEFVGTVLYGGDAVYGMPAALEIVAQQRIEFHQYIGVFQLARDKLPVVETLAEVQHQFDVSSYNCILLFVVPFFRFVAYLPHKRYENIMFLVGHVQRFVYTVIEKGVVPNAFFQMRAAQQVGMKKQCPSRQHNLFAVVFLSTYLAGRDADYRAFVVVVFAASVRQVYICLVVEKDSVNAVVVKAVAHGRHVCIFYYAYKRVIVGVPDVPAVIAYVFYFQYLVCHVRFSFCRLCVYMFCLVSRIAEVKDIVF